MIRSIAPSLQPAYGSVTTTHVAISLPGNLDVDWLEIRRKRRNVPPPSRRLSNLLAGSLCVVLDLAADNLLIVHRPDHTSILQSSSWPHINLRCSPLFLTFISLLDTISCKLRLDHKFTEPSDYHHNQQETCLSSSQDSHTHLYAVALPAARLHLSSASLMTLSLRFKEHLATLASNGPLAST